VAVAQDRCPGVLRLHEAADGLLARVRLPGGRIDARGLRAVATASRMGNWIVELTSRASLQIRGLADEGVAAPLMAAGLLPSASHERVRNILASPLAGPAVDALVAELDRALCADPALARLPGRFLFAVDDGTGLHGRRADVTIVVGGPIGVEEALQAAGEGRGLPGVVSPRRPRLGAALQDDGRLALTVMPPLARLAPGQLDRLAELLPEVRIGVARTLTAFDVDPPALRGLGLVDDPDSGWFGLTACAGLGACAKAQRDVRAQAAARARLRTAADPPEHYAACERNCGAPP
jgi:precorrin-3B synthase